MRPKSALYYVDDISEITNQFLDLMQKNRKSQLMKSSYSRTFKFRTIFGSGVVKILY